MGPLVSTDWLSERMDSQDLVVIDATWFLPGTPRDARAEFAERHIPGAVYFDIDQVSDHSSDLPHMLPEPADFAIGARRLGVSQGSTVVVYDAQGIFSAPRVWWSFRAMGHANTVVLDGGLPKWIAEGRPVESGWREAPHGEFKARPDRSLIRDLDEVRRAIAGHSEQVVDARPAARFSGEAPEPRPGLRSGHMPGAKNLPFSALVGPDGCLLDEQRLRSVFESAGVDLAAPIVTSCGSGVSASVLALGLACIGKSDSAVYDGSWTEWGGRDDTEVVVGPA